MQPEEPSTLHLEPKPGVGSQKTEANSIPPGSDFAGHVRQPGMERSALLARAQAAHFACGRAPAAARPAWASKCASHAYRLAAKPGSAQPLNDGKATAAVQSSAGEPALSPPVAAGRRANRGGSKTCGGPRGAVHRRPGAADQRFDAPAPHACKCWERMHPCRVKFNLSISDWGSFCRRRPRVALRRGRYIVHGN